MKTRSFLAMSMMALLAAGCSSDEITVDNDGGNGGGLTQGTGYVAMNITLPTVSGSPSYAPGTRAASDPTFDHGTPTEYGSPDKYRGLKHIVL